MSGDLLNVWDYERAAEERLEPGAFGYFAGGANDEWTLGENLAAFTRWVLRPRVQDTAGIAKPRNTRTVQDVRVDARDLRRRIGAQSEHTAARLVDQLKGA